MEQSRNKKQRIWLYWYWLVAGALAGLIIFFHFFTRHFA